ncbi:putative flap endonuclease-1-like 5' DNA nuclease [Rhodoblastus acidophilus]|uniref:hypothetical protein n=1 Tax=Rhodoblastus acidophilus TaxID=1074 RepID=UPI002225763C|nr:hypothetical protein [Rhodoblastus acidophilus]MCW2282659.1 putative flap endonuclease-1-like 5' DNA nuclease [Rhodoblastus acidophilus]MCW2331520.1 putative flap endonuclease-1-like 5' DNA nuclease [Rhodoblastus acidophilus]
MIYLSQTLYPWWLAAFGLGVAASFFAPRGDEKNARAWLVGGLSLFALAAMAALAHLVPGRAGLWLDTGVLAAAAYGVGCLVGAALAAPFLIGASANSAPAAKRRLQELLATPVEPAPPPEQKPSDDSAVTAAAGAVAQVFLKLAETSPAQAEQKAEAVAAPAQPEHTPEEAGASRAHPNQVDDLRLIRGVDSALAKKLREIGVHRFDQIAAWGPEQIAQVAEKLGDQPVSPQHWPAQARLLAAGALTDHARAVLDGEPPAPADEHELAAWLETLPQPAAPGAGDGFYAGSRPTGFSEPPLGEIDDLTRLSGVDAEVAARLNGLGVWTWRQIACWSPENARWIGAYLATPGAPEREDWIGQARILTKTVAQNTAQTLGTPAPQPA